MVSTQLPCWETQTLISIHDHTSQNNVLLTCLVYIRPTSCGKQSSAVSLELSRYQCGRDRPQVAFAENSVAEVTIAPRCGSQHRAKYIYQYNTIHRWSNLTAFRARPTISLTATLCDTAIRSLEDSKGAAQTDWQMSVSRSKTSP